MAVMTAQPPLPLVPDDARPVGAAAAIVEDDDGGRVFVHGNLAYAWDAGDTAARRFAAVSLMRIKAATQLEVAEAFAVRPATVRRWETRLTDGGVAGLLAERKGPKRKSKLTGDTVAAIRRLREGGASYRAVAAATGVSEGSVRNALEPTHTDADTDERCAPPGSDGSLPPEPEPEPVSEPRLPSRLPIRRLFPSRDRYLTPSLIVLQQLPMCRSCLAVVWRALRRRCWRIRCRVGPSVCWRGSG